MEVLGECWSFSATRAPFWIIFDVYIIMSYLYGKSIARVSGGAQCFLRDDFMLRILQIFYIYKKLGLCTQWTSSFNPLATTGIVLYTELIIDFFWQYPGRMKDNGSRRLKTPPKRFISYFGTFVGPDYFLDFFKKYKKNITIRSSRSYLLQNDSDTGPESAASAGGS